LRSAWQKEIRDRLDDTGKRKLDANLDSARKKKAQKLETVSFPTVANSNKRNLRQKKYESTEKGRITRRLYESKEIRHATQKRYNDSLKGKERDQRFDTSPKATANIVEKHRRSRVNTIEGLQNKIQAQVLDMAYGDINIEVVSDADKERIQRELFADLGGRALDECVCIVCDRISLKLTSKAFLWELQNESVLRLGTAMDQCLRPPLSGLSDRLRAQYLITQPEGLEELLLSQDGVEREQEKSPNFYLRFCQDCYNSLSNTQNEGEDRMPPKLAIANHFFVGRMPTELYAKCNWVELSLTTLVNGIAATKVVRGGARRAIRSHFVAVNATPAPAWELFPKMISE
jgi:hypothetical protein